MDPWTTVALSCAALAALLAAVAVLTTHRLASASPPATVARAASSVQAMAADLDSRVASLEREFRSLQGHVDTQLEEIQATAATVSKRVARARRAEQAQQVAQGGEPSELDRYPVGHPERRRIIERMT